MREIDQFTEIWEGVRGRGFFFGNNFFSCTNLTSDSNFISPEAAEVVQYFPEYWVFPKRLFLFVEKEFKRTMI